MNLELRTRFNVHNCGLYTAACDYIVNLTPNNNTKDKQSPPCGTAVSSTQPLERKNVSSLQSQLSVKVKFFLVVKEKFWPSSTLQEAGSREGSAGWFFRSWLLLVRVVFISELHLSQPHS